MISPRVARPTIVLLLAATACGSSTRPLPRGDTSDAPGQPIVPPPGATQAMVLQGRTIYNNGTCKGCHGDNGKNGPHGPDLTDGEWLHVDGSYPSIIEIVTSGVAAANFKSPTSNPMFAMLPRGGAPLTDDEVKAVSAYVWTLSHPTG